MSLTSTELRDIFRTQVNDTADPVLWTDEEIWEYMDDAQKQFCLLTDGIQDATSALTQLAVALNGEWVDVDPRVRRIRGAVRTSDGRPIRVINYEDMPNLGIRFDGRVGPVDYIILGIEDDKARLYPKPNVTDTLALVIDRLPLTDITDADQAFEIREQHVKKLLHWMKHRAYSKQDAEARDDQKAAQCELDFQRACAEAQNQRDRAKHKTRVVAYGGI